MGEKGNSITGGMVAGAGSVIERITATATETVTGVGTDFLETVKDKSVGAVADTTISTAKDKLTRRPKVADAPAEEHPDEQSPD